MFFMANPNLDRQIHHLQDEILLLGSMVEQAILNAIDALQRGDVTTARGIYRGDQQINEKRYAIENAVITLMAVQAPKGRDLRLMTSFLEVITDLERMGDYAKGIAKVTWLLEEGIIHIGMRELSAMGDLSVNMLHQAMSAFIKQNTKAASQIPSEDEKIEALYNKVYNNLLSLMISEPALIDQANLLMWAAHDIKRITDRVTSICERTIFIATGELLELASKKEELY